MLPIEALLYIEQSMIQHGKPLRVSTTPLIERLVKRTVGFLSQSRNNASDAETQKSQPPPSGLIQCDSEIKFARIKGGLKNANSQTSLFPCNDHRRGSTSTRRLERS